MYNLSISKSIFYLKLGKSDRNQGGQGMRQVGVPGIRIQRNTQK